MPYYLGDLKGPNLANYPHVMRRQQLAKSSPCRIQSRRPPTPRQAISSGARCSEEPKREVEPGLGRGFRFSGVMMLLVMMGDESDDYSKDSHTTLRHCKLCTPKMS